MKKVFLILIAVLVAAFFLGYNFFSGGMPSGLDADLTREQLSSLQSCGSEMGFYTASPIAPGDYSTIVPLGNLNPATGHVRPADHIYVNIRTTEPDNKESPSVEVPIYSPGNVWLLRVDKVDVYKPIPYSDYTLFFAPCDGVVIEYHHVTTVSKKILDQLANPVCNKKYDESYCIYNLKMQFAAGEAIGTAGGQREKARQMDLQAYDLRLPEAGFVNKARFSEIQLHMACPLDYFAEPLRSELYDRIIRMNQNATAASCGEFEQDKPGTIQGNWVQKGRNMADSENYILALVHENTNQIPVFSYGSEAFPSEDANLLTYDRLESGYTNRDFSEVTNDGKIYCFEGLIQRWDRQPASFSFLVQMTGETSMKISKINSITCCVQPWTMSSNSVEFER